MKLSRKSEYAMLALILLAETPQQLITINEISQKQSIPKKFLEQILLRLKTSGYVASQKGAYGGYKLLKAKESITLAEIIRLFDGALAPVSAASHHFYEKSPISTEPELLNVFIDIRNSISEKLETTTLADVTKEDKF